jgi:tetratricopeptide (TPR) repeat protein
LTGDFNRSYERFAEARAALARHEYDAAIGLFRQSLAESPHFKTHELIGECLLALHRPTDLVEPLRAAIASGNRPSRAHFLLAVALSEFGDRDGAITQVRAALSLNSNYKAAAAFLERLNLVTA